MEINVRNYQKLLLPKEHVHHLNHSYLTSEGFVFCTEHRARCWDLLHVTRVLIRKDAVQLSIPGISLQTPACPPSLSNELCVLKGRPALATLLTCARRQRQEPTPCWQGRSCLVPWETWVCLAPHTLGEGWQLWKTVSEVLNPPHKEILGVLWDKNKTGLPNKKILNCTCINQLPWTNLTNCLPKGEKNQIDFIAST